jgi:hypothetical protein
MTIDNGRRRRLVIEGVFDGMAGESAQLLALIPNQRGRRPRLAREAELDGEPVRLSFVGENPPFVTYRYEREAAE